jgi:hypothetical protein
LSILFLIGVYRKSSNGTLLHCAIAEKSGERTSAVPLPQIHFDHLNFDAFFDRLDDRAMSRITRISRNRDPDNLREQA